MPIPKLLRKLSNISLRKKRSQVLDYHSVRDTGPPSPQEPVPPLPRAKSPLKEYDIINSPPPSHPSESTLNDGSYHVVTPPPPLAAATIQTEEHNQNTPHAKVIANGTNSKVPHDLSEDELDLSGAWKIANEDPITSMTDNVLQKLENGIMDVQDIQTNSTILFSGATASVLQTNSHMKAIEDGVTHFMEGSAVLMKALDEVAKLHPFVGVAVMAFKAVWTLEMTRRGNDKKIIALHVEMKEMMKVLLRLKTVQDPEDIAPDGSTIKGRMQDLMSATAEDIKECANACDTYSKKRLVVKVLKGPIWESRLLVFVDKFKSRRLDFEFALSIHTSLGVDVANKTLHIVDQTTQAMRVEMEMIKKMFKTFVLPDQKKIAQLVERLGGINACQNDDNILKKLGACEQKPGSQPRTGGMKLNAINEASDLVVLKEDLRVDPDIAMKKNMAAFSNKFNQQVGLLKEELSRIVTKQGDRIIDTFIGGPHDKIIDPDVRQIWEEMRWRRNVKTRTFVMVLREYFQEKWAPNSVLVATADSRNDEWALAHLNLTRLQPINEAIDSDDSGFITVTEVNAFTLRPPNWSWPHWIAYWAIGWHQSMIVYRDKINELLAKMFAILPKIKLSNLGGVNAYLNSVHIGIKAITASLNWCSVNEALQGKFRSYVDSEESRLVRKLKGVRYDIDAMDTITLVTGPGRLERFILPLLYILLKHHFELFRICQNHETHPDELSDAASTIQWVLYAVYERHAHLQTLFKHQKYDLKQQFETFAHGIFEYTNDISLLSDLTEVSGEELTDYAYSEELEDKDVKINDVIIHPYEEELDFAAYNPPAPVSDTDHLSRPLIALLGRWNGFEYDETVTAPMAGMISMAFLPIEGEALGFKASSRNYMTDILVSGECFASETADIVDFKFTRVFHDIYPTVYYNGQWEAETDTLTGTCGLGADYTTHKWSFVFKRTAPERLFFLPPPLAFAASKARSLWAYAISSTRAEIRRNHWSWTFFRQRRDNRKRFIELLIREEYGRPLDAKEKEEFAKVQQTFTMADSRFYRSRAAYCIRRTVGHMGYYCDNCQGTIGGGRLICLECQPNDPFNTVDLHETPDCLSAEVFRDDLPLPHLPTHDLVKTRHVVHTVQFKKFYTKAKQALEHARSSFRCKAAKARGEHDDSGSSGSFKEIAEVREVANMSDAESVLACAVCKLPLDQPFWYCVQCHGRDHTFICCACETQSGPMKFGNHEDNHDLVRCHVEDIDTPVETIQEAPSSSTVETEELGKLDMKVIDSRLSRLEALLEIVLKKLDPAHPEIA